MDPANWGDVKGLKPLTEMVYQSWLADRGIYSPGGQPFKSIASEVCLGSTTLILASVAEGDFTSVEAVSRLAGALSASSGKSSWLAVECMSELPSPRILRAVLPTLTNLIYLTKSLPDSADAVYSAEEQVVASRPLRIFYGPKMELMASDAEVKKSFWLQLKSWILSVD